MSKEMFQTAMCTYVTDTFGHINTVREFCEKFPTWKKERKMELGKLRKKEKVDEVLRDTLGGLEKLDCFLAAVEKLAVTSLHVFNENQVLDLSKEINLEKVQVVIIASRLLCPLLLVFKRDAKVFFLPKLQNVEVLARQLDKYIQTTKTIFKMFEKSHIRDLSKKMNKDVLVNLNMSFPEGDVQKMLCHLNQLDEIRNNQHFRMVFLFQEESCSSFINDFNKRQPKMLQFLNEMEECAVQLVKMKKGALISSVAGSSVGAVGSGLSIAGLALIPFTAGLSLGLTIGGTVMGITSGVNSAVTTFTEMGVNSKYRNKADDIIKNLMNEMQNLQKCLEQVISQPVTQIEVSYFLSKATFKGVTNVLSVAWSFRSLSKDVSDIKLIKNGNVIIREGKVVAKEGKALRNIAEVATEVATDGKDVGQATVKGTLATSKSARAGFIAVNALCLGMDIFFICKDSISLAKGSETEVSQFIRARAALWSSEIDSWRKIRDSLNEGLQTSEKRKAVLETPFYLDG